MSATFPKDPNAVLDYAFDWTAWLAAGETITTATITATGVTVDSQSEASGVVTVWLSGGVVGVFGSVTCEIATTGGRTDDRTIRLTIQDR